MQLTKIKLAGFKSFVDPTTIYVPSHLVGVVGPNGCGKSNVIDAVRWVMGESSAKHLRGESMADVIFNGSNARKPVGHASVELVFDNSDGTIGGEFAAFNEISIRRQVSRDGTSNYFLNNTRCRRRDITDIFLGTGLGPRSYSIIEQGTISRLIEAKPDDLRAFLEEAAGISKYKERRRETENRIRHTRENLDRLNDLLEEIDKQLDKLKRQSRAAERYKELKEEERQVKAELLSLRYNAMHEESTQLQQQLSERELEMESELAAQRSIESDLEKLRESLAGANESFNAVQGNYYRLGSDVARVEQAIQHCRESKQQQEQEFSRSEKTLGEIEEHILIDNERLEELAHDLEALGPELTSMQEQAQQSTATLKDVEQSMLAWQEEWDEFNRRSAERAQAAQVERTRLDHLDRHMQQLDERLQRMDQEQQSLGGGSLEQEIGELARECEHRETLAADLQVKQDAALQRISETRNALQQQEQEQSAQLSIHHDTRGRLASLETLQNAALGKRSEQVSGWLESNGLQSAPRLAQQLQVEPGWEHAVETALGSYLEAVCVDGLDNAANWLAGFDEGSVALFDTRSQDADSAADKGASLVEKVQAPWPMGALIAGVYTADSLSQALDMRAGLAAHESVITREGVWIGSGWLRVARDADEKAGVLTREREISELGAQVAAQALSLEGLGASIAAARDQLLAAEAERDSLQREYNETTRESADLKARLSAGKSRFEQQNTRSETVQKESQALREQQEGEVRERTEAQSRLQEFLLEIERLAGEREQLTSKQQHIAGLLEDAREQARTDQQTVHELALRQETLRTTQQATEHALERMREQSSQLVNRRDELRTLLGQGDAPIVELDRELQELMGTRLAVEGELSAARKQVEDIEHRARELDQERVGKERSVSTRREQIEQDRMAWQEVKVRGDTLLEQINEAGFDYKPLLDELDENANVEEWTVRAEKLERRIDRLGPINLAAIDEFEEESKRKVYLDAQNLDLSEALQTLENAIAKIDRETRSRFKETFDQVNTGLQENFPTLFGGGQASLELTGEDLLDTGVTVMARPPGKRNSTIHLLSGGEKALTAIALVFSIFKLNPSPFCMLDEVDAPLDDTNVGRYCDMVRKMSEHVQFIFITHNKITMEMANQLTGVTMHEPGVSRLVSVDVDAAVELVAV